MTEIIKQCVGIDCAKDELVCSFSVMKSDMEVISVSNKNFTNDKNGFAKLLLWAAKLRNPDLPVYYVVEATGVYHESISLFLYLKEQTICVLLPNKIKKFSGTLKVKTVTDKVSAQVIANFGLEKKLDPWQPPSEKYNTLRQLTREREQLIAEKTMIKNKIHAETHGAWVNKDSMRRMKKRLLLLEKQCAEIEDEIKHIVKSDEILQQKINNICSIPGVSIITAATVVAETQGFNLIKNKKQLVSYAGLDVVEKQSGISVHGKPKISKKGNKYLRKSLHMPAFSAIRYQPNAKNLYTRLISKHGIKMKACVAVQRKLLELIYTIWNTGQVYDSNYQHQSKKIEQPKETALYGLVLDRP